MQNKAWRSISKQFVGITKKYFDKRKQTIAVSCLKCDTTMTRTNCENNVTLLVFINITCRYKLAWICLLSARNIFLQKNKKTNIISYFSGSEQNNYKLIFRNFNSRKLFINNHLYLYASLKTALIHYKINDDRLHNMFMQT